MSFKLNKIRDSTFESWRTRVTLVDIDTGEVLTENKLIDYDFINKEKYVNYEQKLIEWTKCYRRSQQLRIF